MCNLLWSSAGCIPCAWATSICTCSSRQGTADTEGIYMYVAMNKLNSAIVDQLQGSFSDKSWGPMVYQDMHNVWL